MDEGERRLPGGGPHHTAGWDDGLSLRGLPGGKHVRLDSILACGSAAGRPGLSDVDRRQLLYLDAVRLGAGELAERLAGLDLGAAPWRIRWASGTDLDPRLQLKLHVGPVTAVTFGVLGQRPLIAVGSRERGRAGESSYRLRVCDPISGQSRELPCSELVRCLSFAMMAEDPLLVSGHDGGWMRIWGIVDSSIRKTVDTGDCDLDELYVAESGRRAHVITGDSNCRVRRWSLPAGEEVGVPGAARACSLSGGWLADGRHVLLMGGDGLSLWDLDDGGLLSLQVPQDFMRVRSVALSTEGGRDCATVVDEAHLIATLDLATGALVGAPITAHVNRRPDGLMMMRGSPWPHPKLAAVSGTLAVPTQWRVHLWNLGTSRREKPAIAGPVTGSVVQAVRWQDRDLLLTGSNLDGVVALWNLDLPVVRAPGHGERVSRVVLAEPADVVVSADEGGTIVARHGTDGRLATEPLATGIESTFALAAWFDGHEVVAAQGAGSNYVSDGNLRRWNMTSGAQYGPPIRAHIRYLHWLLRTSMYGSEVLVTFGPDGMLKIWRPADGTVVAETQTGISSLVTGFATGILDNNTVVALSTTGQPMRLHVLDDLTTPPIIIPEAGDDIVLDIDGPHVVASSLENERIRSNTVRVWTISGGRIGPDIHSAAEVTSAAVWRWPATYVGRADGTVSLTDLETGRDLCTPMLLPSRPTDLAVANNGDLIVGFGSDVARVRSPVA